MTDNPICLEGVWTALITPFRDDGTPDIAAFDRLLDHQARAGVRGLVLCGTTGESPTLTVQEKLSFIRRAKARCGDQLKIMAGTGTQSTASSVELSGLAVDAGADALLVVTPPYSRPNLTGLIRHFQAITAAVGVPVCLYHVPGRTGQKLNADALAAACKIPGVRMVKEASGDLSLFSRARLQSQAEYLSGDDLTFLPSLAVGARGCISVISNVFPAALQALWQAWLEGDTRRALHLHETLLPAMTAMFRETNPVLVKAMMAARGFCHNNLRLPLAPVGVATCSELLELMVRVNDQLDEAVQEEISPECCL